MNFSKSKSNTYDEELQLEELHTMNGGGFFSKQFDLITDYWLGDVISNITHSNRRIKEQTGNGAGSANVVQGPDGKGCTERRLNNR